MKNIAVRRYYMNYSYIYNNVKYVYLFLYLVIHSFVVVAVLLLYITIFHCIPLYTIVYFCILLLTTVYHHEVWLSAIITSCFFFIRWNFWMRVPLLIAIELNLVTDNLIACIPHSKNLMQHRVKIR